MLFKSAPGYGIMFCEVANMDLMHRLYDGNLLFDGAFGTMLHRACRSVGPCPELLNATRPELISSIHRMYAEAGSDAVETNTLGCSPIALARHGLGERAEELCAAAVACAREAVGPDRAVALSVGSTGGMLKPLGTLSVDEVISSYARQMRAGAQAGADVIYIETMGDLAEARLAAIAALECCALPVVCSFTFQNGRLLTGGTPEAAARTLTAVGVSALGINCSGGPDSLAAPLSAMLAGTHLPVIVQPNAGVPHMEDGRTVFPLSPEAMAPKMQALLDMGAAAIGGCCGTTPDHIALMRGLCRHPFVPRAPLPPAPCGPRGVFPPDTLGSSAVEIPPTQDGIYDADPDASMVCVRLDGLSPDEAEAFVLEAQQMIFAPMCFDCADGAVLRRALRAYPGVALTHGQSAYGAITL